MKLSAVLAQITALEASNPDLYDYEVKTEGCDCIGECSGVEIYENTVIFTRLEGK